MLKIKRTNADGTVEYITVTSIAQLATLEEGDVLIFEGENGEVTEISSISDTESVLENLESRSAEIEEEIENASDEALDALSEEIDTLHNQRTILLSHKRTLVKNSIAKPQKRGAFPKASFASQVKSERNALEKRSRTLVSTGKISFNNAEARAALISSGKIATPTQVGGINDAFNTVSSIVDMVHVEDCTGMGSYKVAYVKTNPTAVKYAEGKAITESNPELDFTLITPEPIGCISYISDQVSRQTPLTYAEKIQSCAFNALRASAAKKITDTIYNSNIVENLEISSIDEFTLRKIAFTYGGTENVPGDAVLQLSKADLIAFGDVRGTSEKGAVYEITPDTANPNTGTIKDGGLVVRYCINSNCGALSGAETEESANTMIYGQPQNCTLGLFGDYLVKVSEDFKFDASLLAVRGTVDAGCGVTTYHGFVVVKKSA